MGEKKKKLSIFLGQRSNINTALVIITLTVNGLRFLVKENRQEKRTCTGQDVLPVRDIF